MEINRARELVMMKNFCLAKKVIGFFGAPFPVIYDIPLTAVSRLLFSYLVLAGMVADRSTDVDLKG